MNSSQLLYRISELKYSIRMKELEYKYAIASNEELTKIEHKKALVLLNEELHEAHVQMEFSESDTKKSHSLPSKRNLPFFSWVVGHLIFKKKF